MIRSLRTRWILALVLVFVLEAALVQAKEGAVRIVSTSGAGTTASVTLPARGTGPDVE